MEVSQTDFEDAYWRKGSQSMVYRHRCAIQLLDVKDGPVIDVGCGDGLFLGLLRDKGIDCGGFDMSEVAVRACKDKGLRANVLHSEDELLDIHGKTIVLLDVLEHMFHPEGFLSKASRRYDQLLISVPNFVSLPARLQVLLGKVPENNTPRKGHVYWFTLHVLKDLLSVSGWEIVVFTGNVWGESLPFVGRFMKALARIWPSGLMLSFIIKARRI